MVFVSREDWRSVARVIAAVAVAVAVITGADFAVGVHAGTLLVLAIVLPGGIAVLAGRRRRHAALLREATSSFTDPEAPSPPPQP